MITMNELTNTRIYSCSNILLAPVGMKTLSSQTLFHDPLFHWYHEALVCTTQKHTCNLKYIINTKYEIHNTNPYSVFKVLLQEMLIHDSLVCLWIPSAPFSFPHSCPSLSFLRAWSSSALTSGGLILRDKPSAQGLGTNDQSLLVMWSTKEVKVL